MAALSGIPNLHASELSPEESGVQVYYPGQPACAHYDDLGTIEARSGGGTFGQQGEFASSVRRLKRMSNARMGNALIITEHKVVGTLDTATGKAIRCKVAP